MFYEIFFNNKPYISHDIKLGMQNTNIKPNLKIDQFESLILTYKHEYHLINIKQMCSINIRIYTLELKIQIDQFSNLVLYLYFALFAQYH